VSELERIVIEVVDDKGRVTEKAFLGNWLVKHWEGKKNKLLSAALTAGAQRVAVYEQDLSRTAGTLTLFDNLYLDDLWGSYPVGFVGAVAERLADVLQAELQEDLVDESPNPETERSDN
jgi:hypothetical protein